MRRPIEFAQYTSFDYTQQLDDAKVVASVGSVGDAYDNAMAESLVDSYKTELIRDRVWPNPHPARARHDRMGRLLQHVMPRSA